MPAAPGANFNGWKRKQKVIYMPFSVHSNGPKQCFPVITIFYADFRYHCQKKRMIQVYSSFTVGLN